MKNYPFSTVIFDLDGVITNTASEHSQAWKKMFDDFLKFHADENGIPFLEFTHEKDYLPYVDGKPRYQGVSSFLVSRGIELPEGTPEDTPGMDTVCALGNTKNEIYNKRIHDGHVQVYQSTVDFIRELKKEGIRIGVASSSKNARSILNITGLISQVETLVDGEVSAKLGLQGKPQADIFTTACDNLGGLYDQTVIVEDAISGVQAGQNGGFGLVLGIAREDNALALRSNGADIVVEDISEINLQKIRNWFEKDLEEENWKISYYDFVPKKEQTRETLLTIGNGYFGTRGALEESKAGETHYPGTYIAGLYNRLESEVSERMISNEDFVNCPNWLPVTFKIDDGKWFDPEKDKILKLERHLDLRNGVLERLLITQDARGRQTQIKSKRLASMAKPHLAAMSYEVKPLNYSGEISIRSSLDGTIINAGVKRYRALNSSHLESQQTEVEAYQSSLLVNTNQSGVLVGQCASLTVLLDEHELHSEFEHITKPGRVDSICKMQTGQNQSLKIEKIVSIYSSNQELVSSPLEKAKQAIQSEHSFEKIAKESAEARDAIWKKIDIRIEGDRLAQKLMRLHLYHLFVMASPHNIAYDAGFPARGLHGEAYRGHIFWDEIYISPLYNLSFPEISKAGLMYRVNRLNEARKLAKEFGYEGAMFPWQSGSSGGEETQTLHLNPLSGKWGNDYSTLQRHVSLAVAYNIYTYVHTSQDIEFLAKYGLEVYLEICRFWASKAQYSKGKFDIPKVMGPDEFHEKYPEADSGGLTNNSYTNIMVVWMIDKVQELITMLNSESVDLIIQKIGLTGAELVHWGCISIGLNIPLSREGILEQYEGYFELEELDWETYRQKYGNIHRMDRILKAEGKSPDAYKVSKQADALMAFYLLPEDEIIEILKKVKLHPPHDLLKRNLDYYLPRTSHGSTLSRLVHAYLAWKTGEQQLGWKLYMQALKSDFVDIQGGTTKEGIHAGVMAGTVYFSLRAFAGLSFENKTLQINPELPKTWRKLSFTLMHQNSKYQFEITQGELKVFTPDENKSISTGEKEHVLPPDEWLKIKTP